MSPTRRVVTSLPIALTLGNMLCGFLSIALVAKGFETPNPLYWAAWLLFLAMIFDALDGKVARMTGSSSDFGGELDSLADMVTFGLAPGLLTSRVLSDSGVPPLFAWGVAAVYVSCVGLRLARFNATNSLDEDAHKSFCGLPSPAAAAAIGSLVLLSQTYGARTPWIPSVLPFWAVGLGLLMVSSIQHVHLGNRLLRARRGVVDLAPLVIGGAALVVMRELALAVACQLFALSGVLALLRRPVAFLAPRLRRAPR